MKLLIDVNVLLDLVLDRQPWSGAAVRLISAVESGKAKGYVAGHTITTLFYLVARLRGKAAALSVVEKILRIVEVVPVDKATLLAAVAIGLPDFEDAVQACAGAAVGADYIVTRDKKHFTRAQVEARTPDEILTRLR